MTDEHKEKIQQARKALYDSGINIRRDVTGAAHVDRSTRNVSDFSRPMQELATELVPSALSCTCDDLADSPC